MKIIAIKTNEGFLISDNLENNPYFSSKLDKLFFDGIYPEKTFKKYWFKVKAKPNKIEIEKPQPTINRRWEINSKFKNGVFKDIWVNSEVFDIDGEMKPEFSSIKGLYEYKEDLQPKIIEKVDFEWEEILEIDIFKEPTGFRYEASGKYNSDDYVITGENLKIDILNEVLTPPILLHTQPCRLSSKQSYDIVRKYIKENINPRISEITSDYDFCFTVKKKIPISKPYSFQIDTNNSIFDKRKRNPNYITRFVDSKSVEIFEMTHNQATNNNKGYEKYTVIKGFEAENQESLKEYIDKYLEELILVINEPVCECDKCNGTGVLLNNLKE